MIKESPFSVILSFMVKVLVIGDSHHERIRISNLNFAADVDARGGKKAHHLSENTFNTILKNTMQSLFSLVAMAFTLMITITLTQKRQRKRLNN